MFLKKIKILFIVIIFSIFIPIYSDANEIEIFSGQTQEFLNWYNSEDKENKVLPKLYEVPIPNNNYELEKNENTNLIKTFNLLKNKAKSEALNEKFDLKDKIEIEVKNQYMTNQCWAFSTLSSMETNLLITKGEKENFSERHMAYATSSNFIDGKNEKGFSKLVAEGGLQSMGLAYLTNGQGAVLENQMPFEDNENEIYLNQIDIQKNTYVSDYVVFPSIYKKKDNNGKLVYIDANYKEYSNEEIKSIRDEIKEHIVNYGGITAVTACNELEYYNNQKELFKSTAYFCDDFYTQRDHGVTIVGWDDNYSRLNFNEEHRPSSDGAYIVLNSYGQEIFDNGYIYISYEDALIETSLYGIISTSDVEYYKMYQHDYYGGIATLGTVGSNTGYYSNIYKRDINEVEILSKVAITVPDYCSLNIYVNPNGEDLSKHNLIKVGNTNELEPGYHTIDIEDIELNSDKFAIMVEQVSEEEEFIFSIEAYLENSPYENVSSEKGTSKISFDGNTWYDISEFGQVGFIDTSKSDVCIKAFTEKPEEEKPKDERPEDDKEELIFESEIYKIEDKYIKNISVNTTFEEFKNNIESNKALKVIDNDKEISNLDKLKTGMKIIVEDKEYIIVVLGDINSDGRISLVDISKLVLHYNEDKNFILTGANKEAGDMNLDGKISLVDISKFIILFNTIN